MEGDPYSRYSTTHYDYGRWYYEKNKNANKEIISNPEGINNNNNNNIENQIPVQEEQNNQNEIKDEREAVNS